MLFLSPSGIGKQVNLKLVANQVSRQWFGTLVSPTTRNHMWLENGMARYSEMLYVEHVNGPGAMDTEIHDAYVEALTVDQPPMIQAARLEDYSPEYWATTGGKGAAVLQMLRNVLGDDAFMKVLKEYPARFAWKSANTDDFHKICEEAYGQSSELVFPAMGGIERRAGIQNGVYGVPHAEGFPRDGQDFAGSGLCSACR